MSAGTGITHSEYNASQTEPVHFLQIWIVPERHGLPPGYEQKAFPEEARRGRWQLIGDRQGADGAITVHQDVRLYVAELQAGQSIGHTLLAGRHVWLQVARGIVRLNGNELREGDGAAVTGEPGITLDTDHGAEVLLFDLR